MFEKAQFIKGIEKQAKKYLPVLGILALAATSLHVGRQTLLATPPQLSQPSSSSSRYDYALRDTSQVSFSQIINIVPSEEQHLSRVAPANFITMGLSGFDPNRSENQIVNPQFANIIGYDNAYHYLSDKVLPGTTYTNPVNIRFYPGNWDLNRMTPSGEQCELYQDLLLAKSKGNWIFTCVGPGPCAINGFCAAAANLNPGIELRPGDSIVTPTNQATFNDGSKRPIGFVFYNYNAGGVTLIRAHAPINSQNHQNDISAGFITVNSKDDTGYALESLIHAIGNTLFTNIKTSNGLGAAIRNEGGGDFTVQNYVGENNTGVRGGDIRMTPYFASFLSTLLKNITSINPDVALGAIYAGREGRDTAPNNSFQNVTIKNPTTDGNGAIYAGSGTDGVMANISISQTLTGTEGITIKGDSQLTEFPAVWTLTFIKIMNNAETNSPNVYMINAMVTAVGNLFNSDAFRTGQVGIHDNTVAFKSTLYAAYNTVGGKLADPDIKTSTDIGNREQETVQVDEDGCIISPPPSGFNPTWRRVSTWLESLFQLVKNDRRQRERFSLQNPNLPVQPGSDNCSSEQTPTTTPSPEPSDTATAIPSPTSTRQPSPTSSPSSTSTPQTRYFVFLPLVYVPPKQSAEEKLQNDISEQMRYYERGDISLTTIGSVAQALLATPLSPILLEKRKKRDKKGKSR